MIKTTMIVYFFSAYNHVAEVMLENFVFSEKSEQDIRVSTKMILAM